MYKTLTRTLKLGLTAITILTAGGFAGTAFAQYYDHHYDWDFVEHCASYPDSDSCGSTETARSQVANCIANPFGRDLDDHRGGCANVFTPQRLVVAKTRHCGTGTNYILPVCADIVARPNAANWIKQHSDVASSVITASGGNQFLKGTAGGLNTTGAVDRYNGYYFNSSTYGTLRFSTIIYSYDFLNNYPTNVQTGRFNNAHLSGNSTDGVAFFLDRKSGSSYYAAVSSGTDLGAPVRENSGTKARWVGQFRALGFEADSDFVLEVTFGASNTGSIAAFIKRQSSDRSYSSASHYRLEGTFNDTGLITGTVDAGNYADNDRDPTAATGTRYAGVLTGLIGKEGAVGAFYSTSASYAGGFVARPAEDVTGASVYLKNLCTSNPSHDFCFLPDTRIKRIVDNCMNNPLGTSASDYGSSGCAKTLDAEQYKTAKARYCDNPNNQSLAICRPTAVRWSFEYPDAPSAARSYPRPNFLKGTKTGLDTTGVEKYTNDSFPDLKADGALNFNTATFNDTRLGGEETDGVAFFRNGGQIAYVGFFSGTDLGAPVTGISGTTARWVGQFQAISWIRDTDSDFILEVTFGGDGDKAGSIEALIEEQVAAGSYISGGVLREYDSFTHHFYLKGDFDNSGLITGAFTEGNLTGKDRDYIRSASSRGVLTGLIGKKGAVGAFLSKNGLYVGGFVARPAEDVTGASVYLKDLCTSNPSHEFCFVTDARMTRIINNCMNNPLGTSASEYGSSGCTKVLGTEQFNVAMNSYCDSGNNRMLPGCRPTVALWGIYNPDAPITPNTINRQDQFLKGTPTGVNEGTGLTVNHRDTLKLSTARFGQGAGVALGGSDTDGVSYFTGTVRTLSRWGYYNAPYGYAGILSGTDLGDPIAETRGTAKWVGKFSAAFYEEGLGPLLVGRDFVLEVDYATKSLDAFVHAFVHAWSVDVNVDSDALFYRLDGHYDSSGLITGEFKLNGYHGRTNVTYYGRKGSVTGLIGKEGAVGVFHSGGNPSYEVVYAGGFVARPAADVAGAEAYLDKTCKDNPSHLLCFTSNERAVRILDDCSGTLPSPPPAYCTDANVACVNNPFGADCHGALGGHALRIAKVNYCGEAGNRGNDNCTTLLEAGYTKPILKNPNAANWVKEASWTDTPLKRPTDSAPDAENKRNQFLKGTVDEVDDGVLSVSDSDSGSLNLKTAEFNGKKLDGYATDGVAFFVGEFNGSNDDYAYAGIFSGTDLGAPVAQTTGAAIWFGSFAASNLDANEDFVLEITFGSTEVNKSGTISAFVQIADAKDFLIEGHFNAQGVIVGDVAYKDFTASRPVLTEEDKNGTLTGLIGQEGAIGAFISKGTAPTAYAGGFVARPVDLIPGLASDFIADTCTGTDGDPFHPFCHVADVGKVAMDLKRNSRVAECIQDGNAVNNALCQNAIDRNPCILNPFDTNCSNFDGVFEYNKAVAQEKRLEFCNTAGNGNHGLCMDDNLTELCNFAPFSPICSEHTDFDDIEIANKFDECRGDNSSLDCHGVTLELAEANKRPDAATWVDSFITFEEDRDGLSTTPDTGATEDTTQKNQFLQGAVSELAKGDFTIDSSSTTLNVREGIFKGHRLGGAAIRGVSFFKGKTSSTDPFHYYAGILVGTDLGAPVTQTSGRGSWVGKFAATNLDENKDFVLEVTFGSDVTGKAGSIAAFVRNTGVAHFLIDGHFNAEGVIGGHVTYGDFAGNDRNIADAPARNGQLTGLIGQQGAAGAFISNATGPTGYAGGFVARPVDDISNAARATLDGICNSNNPFTSKNDEFCYLEYAIKRAATIDACLNPNGTVDDVDEDCIEAAKHNTCINNPFADACADDPDFKDIYADAKMNRAKFCTTDLTNDLCKGDGENALSEDARGEDARKGICEYAPFTDICFKKGNDFDDDRETKIASCDTKAKRDADSTCLGITKNPNAVAWVSSFALSKTPTTEPNTGTELGNQFLAGGAERLDGDNVRENHTALTLADISVEGTVTVGDSADGVAFFGDTITVSDSLTSLPFYAGILSGTDLGAPVSGISGTVAKWKGIFQAIGEGDYATRTEEFILEVNFTGEADNAGKIAAFVQSTGDKYYHLVGSFNNAGIIDGTVDYGSFEDNERNDPRGLRRLGQLTGLIGQQGAVGAFIADMVRRKGFYSGGFVARHLTTGTTQLDDTCNINPFHSFCDGDEYKEQRHVMILNNCQGRPDDDRLPSYCTHRDMLEVFYCVNNPFGGNCDQVLGADFNAIVKVRYCGDGSNIRDPNCDAIKKLPNAARWASEQDSLVRIKPNTNSPKNEFLRGAESSLNEGNIEVDDNMPQESLDLETAAFKTNLLGGNARDGVAFFTGHVVDYPEEIYYYAGIFSDTDLGAPVTQTTGAASWVGKFAATNLAENEDFVLEVTFGNTTEGKGGSIAAFINGAIDDATDGATDFYLIGDFDEYGLIIKDSGKIAAGNFSGNNRADIGDTDYNGVLTGLIGQEGAVGAFISNDDVSVNKSYAGGFVARFVNAALADICNTNPFTDRNKELCYLEYAKDRVGIMSKCIKGNNIKINDDCDVIPSDLESCILNPFDTTCEDNADFKTYSANTKQNRIDFCLGKFTAGVTNDALCIGYTEVVDGICDYAPFAEICFKESLPDYDDYADGRKSKFTKTCRTDADDPTCHGVKNNPNAVAWEHNTDNLVVADAINKEAPTNQFIKGTTGDINRGDVVTDSGQEGTLNLNGAKFGDNRPLQGDEADGVAFFMGLVNSTAYGYAGIFSGTDLGAPLKAEDTTAEWVGKFQSVGEAGDNTFVLAVNLGARTLAAFVPYANGSRHFQIAGDYTSKGVISGYIRIGDFPGVDQVDLNLIEVPTWGTKGKLTGLIGKEGAVGAFHGTGVAGGFVARPADDVTDAATDIAAKCASNPFHHYCYVKQEYTTERDSRIEDCIDADGRAGDSAYCGDAIAHNPCIENPFATDCQTNTKFSEYYTDAKANRITFCNNTGSRAQDSLCTDASVIKGICDFTPFASACFFEGNQYDEMRNNKFATCRENPDDTTCHGVTERPNVIAWEESFNATGNNDAVVKLPSMPDSATRSQFLKSAEYGLGNGGIFVRRNNLGDVYFDKNGLTVADMNNPSSNLDSNAGVSFFWGNTADGVTAYYAGILNGTKLGSPLTDISGTTASWQGVFETVGVITRTDFTLNVTFGNDVSKTGSITAFIERKSTDTRQALLPDFIIKGTFDKYGLISGNVFAGKFTDGTDHTTSIGTKSPAVLTGIIGQDGAVGAFVSGTSDDDGKTISKNTAEGTSNYSGGFVATPDPCVAAGNCPVKYADWLNVTMPAVFDSSSVNYRLQNRFVRSIEKGNKNRLDTGNLPGTSLSVDLENATYDNVALGGQAADGFSAQPLVSTDGSWSYLAGIKSTTNLGVPLSEQPIGTWNGLFQVYEGGNSVNTDFNLTVTFGGASTGNSGSVSAVIANTDYSFTGEFDSRGVIDGTVTHTETVIDSTGVLQGLIGVEGAVGVFLSDLGQTQAFGGGFVAAPEPCVAAGNCPIKYADWLNVTMPAVFDSTATGYTLQNRFVRSIETDNGNRLDTGSLPGASVSVDLKNATYNNLALNGDAADGFSVQPLVSSDRSSWFYLAGIKSTTNLGMPLSEQPTGVWNGLFQVYEGGVKVNTDFNLTVTFGGASTGNSGSVSATIANTDYSFTGEFDSRGVIEGTVTHTETVIDSTGVLQGLIGVEGAVGVFLSNPDQTQAFGGGFVARPTQ